MNGRRYLHQPTLTDLPYSPSPQYRSTTHGLPTPVLRTSWSSSTTSPPSKRQAYHQRRSRHSRSSSHSFVQDNDDHGDESDSDVGDEEDGLGRRYSTHRHSYSSPGQHLHRQQHGYQDQDYTNGQQLSYQRQGQHSLLQQGYSPSRQGTRRQQQQQRTSFNPTSNEKKTTTKPPHSQTNRKRAPIETVTHQPYYGSTNDEVRVQRKPLPPIVTMDTSQKPRYLCKQQQQPLRQQLQPDSAHMGHAAPVGWKVSGQYDHLVLRSPLSPTPPSLYDSSSSSTTLSSSSDPHHRHHRHHQQQQQQQQQQQRQQRINGSSLTTNGLIYHRRTRSSSGTKHVIDYQQQQQRQSTTPSIASSSVSSSINETKSSGRYAASSSTTTTTTTNSLSTRSRHSYDDPGPTKAPERPRRYSQGDCSNRHSVPLHSPPAQQLVARRVSTPKLRRICSAKPYINNNNNSNYDDDDLVMDAASLSITKKSSSSFAIESDQDDTDDNDNDGGNSLGVDQLSHQPNFWNPRSPKDVIPVKRTLSRRLRGLLLPQRSKLDTTVSKDHHLAADYQWSLTRPTTPVHDLSFDNDTILEDQENGVMDNPFYMISQSWDIVDQISLHFDEDDFTQMDTYATSVQQIGPTLTPQTLSQKFLARPYRRDLYRLRIIYIWIIQNIAIIDQRSDDKTTSSANGSSQQQPAPKTTFRQRFTARKSTTSALTTDPGDDLERPALDVMHGDGLLPEGGTDVDSFDDWLFSESAQQVLLHRACSSSIGMANLFSEMATAAGFHDTRVVYGYLRAPKDSIDTAQMDDNDTNDLTGDNNYTLIQNHAWCCVKVEGEYRFVDCWLASPFQPQNKAKMEPHWFLTKPTDMIYTHFPQDPADQCLEPTIPVSTFFALPYVWASFFSHHIKMIRYNPHAIHLVDDQVCHLTFRVDPNVVCFAYIEVDPNLTLRCLAQSRMVPDQNGKSERIYKVKAVLPPGHDQGWLKIYAGTSSSFSSTTATPAPVRQDNISNGTSLLISRHTQSTTTTPSIAPSSITTTELPPLVMCFRLTHRRHLVEDRNRPFEFVHLHHHDFYIREPQCYHLYPLQTYNFLIRGGDDAHHKLAIKSPSGKLYKLMYYPQEHTYDGSVKIAESGKWSLISLLHHAGGWYVVATWECKS